MALKVEQIEHALQRKKGNVSAAARDLGVTRKTLYNHIQKSPTLQQVLEDSREELVDVAESALYKQILSGNTAAIIFALKTVGKDRGYVERQEYTGKDGSAIDQQIKVIIDYQDSNPKTGKTTPGTEDDPG